MELFLKAFIIGLSIAMPIGPIATFLIKNSLERGWKMGFAVGLGAALVEGFYGFVVSGGFVIISDFVKSYANQISVVGGLLLIYLGWREISNCRVSQFDELKVKPQNFPRTVIFVSLLTLANPMTMLFFAGVIASMSKEIFDIHKTLIMVLGTFLGSLTWTTFLSGIVASMRHKIEQKWVIRIKFISGVIISIFGLLALLDVIIK